MLILSHNDYILCITTVYVKLVPLMFYRVIYLIHCCCTRAVGVIYIYYVFINLNMVAQQHTSIW